METDMESSIENPARRSAPRTAPHRAPRWAFIAGSCAAMFIGALHTFVHLRQLTGDELKARFDEMGDIDVSGSMTASWELFQGLSLLMGVFCFTVGVVNLVALRAAANGRPPVGICLANIAMLCCVVVVGVLYLGATQTYGGLAGIAAFATPIVIRR